MSNVRIELVMVVRRNFVCATSMSVIRNLSSSKVAPYLKIVQYASSELRVRTVIDMGKLLLLWVNQSESGIQGCLKIKHVLLQQPNLPFFIISSLAQLHSSASLNTFFGLSSLLVSIDR